MSQSVVGCDHQRLKNLAVLAATILFGTACEPNNPCEGVEVIPASQTFTTEEVCQEAALFEATATIGYGTGEHLLFDENVVLHVEHGPQGGQHIYGSVWLTGMNPGERAFSEPRGCGEAQVYDTISIVYTLSFPDSLYSDVIGSGGWWLEDGTTEQALGGSIQLEMDIFSVIATYPDQTELPLAAHVVVTDACGTTAEDTATFMLSLDE
jgi:hypothetical protein